MSNFEEIKKELQGKTGMEGNTENDLFERIALIEATGGCVAPLQKIDWFFVGAFLVIFGIAPVLWYAMQLF